MKLAIENLTVKHVYFFDIWHFVMGPYGASLIWLFKELQFLALLHLTASVCEPVKQECQVIVLY